MIFNPRFVSNTENKNFYSILKSNLQNCKEFKICVSFLRWSGYSLLLDTFKELQEKGVYGKILCSTYMGVTQASVLESLQNKLNKVDENGKRYLEFKIYVPKEKENGFHSKGYLFKNSISDSQKDQWTVIIGSSNISQAALKTSVEWNLINNEEISEFDKPGVLAKSVLDEFDELWDSEYSKEYSDEFLISYRDYLTKIKKFRKQNPEIFNYTQQKNLKPNLMQSEAITKLDKLRNMNQNKALAVAATGTGKTYLAVFDAALQVHPKKLLFVVHREDILRKAKESFDSVVPTQDKNYKPGFFTGTKKEKDSTYLFATIDTISRHYDEFAKNEFDYIVIDEAHHAAAESYQKILSYYKPKFLLGLTATPERTDGQDIFKIFDYQVATNIRLRDSLEKNLICPFHYFGIKDIDGIDYTTLKHKPDEDGYLDEVAMMLMKSKRTEYIIDKIDFYGFDGDKPKCLGFCSTVKHSQFMADEFNKHFGDGSAIALSGNDSISFRQQKIMELEKDETKLSYIFTVDIFNEGIDIQKVNLVLMLRPTQSSIIYTQQLGRGLRKNDDKEYLTVLDFIGNYQKSFLISSVFSKEQNPDKKTRLREVQTEYSDIPGNTFIQFDKIVKEQILRQIDSEKFMSDINQKKTYFNFKKDIGNNIPMLMDYFRYGSEIDPVIFTKIKKGNILYQSYFEFVVSAENQLNSEYSDLLNQLRQNSIFTTFMKFLNTLLPAKRIEEWCIIKELIEHTKSEIEVEYFVDILQKYVDYDNPIDVKTLKHACNLLSGKYWDSNEQKNYDSIKFNFIDNKIKFNENVCKIISNEQMKKWILDYVEYAILRYDDEFGRTDYGFPFLKPYAKYSMKQIAPLCCYEKIHSSFRGSGLITSAKPDYFIFVDLYKEDSIRAEINYNDIFISPILFQWESPNDMTQSSERGKDVINCSERGIKLHLFVRKFKEVENIPQDFIYLGDVVTHKDSASGEKPVKMNFALHEVPQDLYNDFITKVDITKQN